ncbi:MAG: citrate lyase ACP [Candidatus Izemoplasmatales bacterium]|uniref:Citrate lyase acyl carrier protein n=1 Tax=Hujiaoplasma nucleasis TaxID=2725268 RepID=A0A7L6N2Q2_9MOLU|nr:citrate lyase acyl carrier protein [Hujiaoplasma nucleasis]QLY40540.1 citrate lyase acyl carrier protein [Hujiaoplasma nucleasis]
MIYQAGSKESNDCLVTIKKSDKTKIHIDSIVGHLFYDQILKTVEDTLREEKVENIEVTIEDLGALDYTIRARLIVAIRRMRKDV